MIKKRFQTDGESFREYMQEWFDDMLITMKLEGVELEDCTQQVRLFADFVRARADELPHAWQTRHSRR